VQHSSPGGPRDAGQHSAIVNSALSVAIHDDHHEIRWTPRI
jgi:hypothetical protein